MTARKNLIFSAIIIFLLAACTTSPAETPQEEIEEPASDESPGEEGTVIVFGDITDDPGEVIEGTQPLADYVAARLGDYGITEGQVKIAASADEMAQMLENGEVDLYFDSVYPATLISDQTGAQPFLRRWRFGVEEYCAVIFASVESGITSVDELPGHMIALENPYSTSGFAMPAFYLTGEGLSLVGKESNGEPVEEDEVGFVFSYDDENTLQWVLSGLVAAGATDDYHWDVAFPDEVREQLVKLADTEGVPRQVAVARPDIDPELLEAVKQILLAAHEDEDGQAALEAFQTTRFDEFPEGIEAALDRMREMMEVVQGLPMP